MIDFARVRAALLALLLVAFFSLLGSTQAGADTYEIAIQNHIPGGEDTGQPFSPPVVIVHNTQYSLFQAGAPVSPGLELVAREGDPTLLETEARNDPNVSYVAVGTGPFYDTQVLTVEANPGDLISAVWMLGRTNDLFSGFYDIALPRFMLQVTTHTWDSGTEENSGLIEDIPFYGNRNSGTDEDGVTTLIESYTIHNDPEHTRLEWTFPPTANVVITPERLSNPAVETSWGKIKATLR